MAHSSKGKGTGTGEKGGKEICQCFNCVGQGHTSPHPSRNLHFVDEGGDLEEGGDDGGEDHLEEPETEQADVGGQCFQYVWSDVIRCEVWCH